LLDPIYAPDAMRIMTAIGIPRDGLVADIGRDAANATRPRDRLKKGAPAASRRGPRLTE